MHKTLLLKKRLEEGRRRVENQPRTCLIPGCSENAIKRSHVLQEREILKGIVDQTNHFYAIGHVPVFEMNSNQVFKIAKVGINDGYTFPGFCRIHDGKIFEAIEKHHPIDFSQPRNLLLFMYRTVCLELRKKEIYLDLCRDILQAYYEIEPQKIHVADFEPAEQGTRDLCFDKSEIQAELFFSGNADFEIDVLRLPQKKVCFSAVLSIEDPSNEFTQEVDIYGFPKEDPLAVSVLNYFPYRGNSILIAAHHRKYPCNWTRSLVTRLREGKNIDKIISDILTYRLEFWGIAPELYESIPEKGKRMFVAEAHDHIHNHSINIKSDFNLFS